MNQLPTGHLLARRLAFIALLTTVAIVIIWFLISKVLGGDVAMWFNQFRYEQENLFYSLYYAWKWPWG